MVLGKKKKIIYVSHNDLERWVTFLMIRQESGLKRKKIVHISLWEDAEVWQGELKTRERANKWKKVPYLLKLPTETLHLLV